MKAYELLDKEDKWTKGQAALDVEGKVVDSCSPDAVRWCAVGALLKCYGEDSNARLDKLTKVNDAIRRRCPSNWYTITSYNDARLTTFEDIYTLLKECDA